MIGATRNRLQSAGSALKDVKGVGDAELKIIPRWSTERGHADHGWLRTFHTFSFAMYQDWDHMQFGNLRVINEDRVKPGTGFGTHSHAEFEIFSYVVSGKLEHKDSMKNVEILKRGDLQLTSAGSPGISHSEKCHGSQTVHFLQIWAKPWVSGLNARYYTRSFSDEEKKDKWCTVVAPAENKAIGSNGAENVSMEREASGPAPVQSPITLFATILSPGGKLPSVFPQAPSSPSGDGESTQRRKYIHIIQTSGYNNNGPAKGSSVRVGNGGKDDTSSVVLREGDGAYIFGTKGRELFVENVGGKNAEVLLFDVE